MANVTAKVVQGILTITVDLKKGLEQARPSSSGKSMLIATASEKLEGFEGVRFGVNVYKKA